MKSPTAYEELLEEEVSRLKSVLRDAVELLEEYETESRAMDSGNVAEVKWRTGLKGTIAEGKLLQ